MMMMMMMSLSEMEKNATTEDECVDSGAETGGSDYSPMSSASSESSMVELQDPFLVSVHLIADPGQGPSLQCAADAVLSWVHPELQLFRVSERASTSSSTQRSRLKRQTNGGLTAACQPALAVILFLQESCGGEEQILTLHRTLQRPPWRYHHTEKVGNGRRMLPLAPCSQDFFTLAPGTPLWAVRQVHYGKEIVRLTVYCRHENYVDMVRLYKLLLQRRVAQKKEDFCFFVVYSNPDTEIQLSFKRLPRGQSPVPTEAAVMEVRVRDVGALVPLLPRPCSPISEVRWQTEDYDGNKILLQIQGARFKSRQDAMAAMSSPSAADSLSVPYMFGRSAASHRNRRYRLASRTRVQNQASLSQASLPLACEEMGEEEEQWDDQHHHPDAWRSQWRNLRSSSLFSLPGLGLSSSHSTGSSPAPSPAPHYRSHSLSRTSSLIPPFRLNVDALIGAEETDVDTGDKVDSDVDLTVVSAYIKSSRPRTPCPLLAPPEDIGPAPSPGISGTAAVKPSKSGRPPVPKRTSSLSSNSTPSTLPKSRPQSTCLNTSRSPSLSDISLNQWDSSNSISGLIEDRSFQNKHKVEEEEDQEFYI